VAELERVRADGFAFDREEFDANFCCIAAPIFDDRGRFAAVLGLSVTANVFDAECEHLAEIVVDVAQGATVAASSSPRHGAVRNGASRAAAARNSASHAGRSRISTVSRVAS
jgi:transcriptional regulator of acetoin/glycerol metabolism